MATSRSFRSTLLGALFLLFATFLVAAPAGAQSAGCTGGPYDGATATDSDGDGVSDADEVTNSTDECDPNDTPTQVCGGWIADYDASTADTDGDGDTDAAEIADGSDPCDLNSQVSAGTVSNVTTPAAPTLALTGPSVSMIVAFFGVLLVALGGATLLIGRRVEA